MSAVSRAGQWARAHLPAALVGPLAASWRALGRLRLRLAGRPRRAAEPAKARPRRLREGFFDRYCRGRGIDIGYGGDPVTDDCDVWDMEHGDAQLMEGVGDARYDWVYTSHLLEHVPDAAEALRSWWRILKPGGYLMLYLPHRDLYEKKRTLPSRWNEDHKTFFLVDHDDPPDTLGIVPLLARTLPDAVLVYAKECSEGLTITDPERHSDGEYSIEVVCRKPPRDAA